MAENTIQDHRIVKPISILDFMLSFFICAATVLVLTFLNLRLRHWCIIPVFICGIMIGIDAMRWLRGGVDTFDPKGVIGMFGLNFFFFAPLLFLYYEMGVAWVDNPPDWRPWIGIIGWFNVAGIIVYQLSQSFAFWHSRPAKKIWAPSPGKSTTILCIAIFLSIAFWGVYLVRMGGFGGVMREKLYADIAIGGVGTFKFFAAALMPLLLIALTIWKKDNTRVNMSSIIVILTVGFVIQFLTAGFGGSRLRVMSPFIWAVGIIHYYWRDLTPRLLLLGMIPIVLFVFIYGLYKAGHERFVDIILGRATISQVAEATHETIPNVLVHDMSRTGIQAWMMHKWFTFRGDYDLRYGITYLQAPVALAPKWLFKWKVTGGSYKVRAGTEYLFGKGYFDPLRQKKSGAIYGLAGEAILNFGLWAIPFMFAFWGLLVGWLRRKWLSWPMGDCRLLIMPWLSILVISLLANDSDVHWSIIISQVIIPSFVAFLISSRVYPYNES